MSTHAPPSPAPRLVLGSAHFRHPGLAVEVRCLAFSADGARLASGSNLGTVCLFDTATGERVGPILEVNHRRGEPDRIHAVALSRDGGRVIARRARSRGPEEIWVWDAASGAAMPLLSAWGLGDPATSWGDVALSPDGRLAAVPERGLVTLYDVDAGRTLRELRPGGAGDLPDAGASGATFSPDGSRLACAQRDRGDGAWVWVFDVATAERLALFHLPPGSQSLPHLRFASADDVVAISGGRAFTCAVSSRRAREIAAPPGEPAYDMRGAGGGVWIARRGNHPAALHVTHPAAPDRVIESRPPWAVSPDGRLVAASFPCGARVFRVADGAQVAGEPGHTAPASGVFFEDEAIVTAGAEDLAWSRADGRPLAARPDRAATLRARTAAAVPALEARLRSSAVVVRPIDADTVLVVEDRAHEVWHLPSAARRASFQIRRGSYDRAISPDGKRLAVSETPGDITLWDLTTGAIREELDATPRCPTSMLAWSPDSRVLLAAGEDTAVRLFVVGEGREPAAVLGKHGRGSRVRCASTGIFATSDGACLRLWDLALALDPATVKQALLAAVPSGGHVLGFSPDGAELAVADPVCRVEIHAVSELRAAGSRAGRGGRAAAGDEAGEVRRR